MLIRCLITTDNYIRVIKIKVNINNYYCLFLKKMLVLFIFLSTIPDHHEVTVVTFQNCNIKQKGKSCG